MNREEIIRAWKDEEYRLTLSSTELAALPAHPSGVIELSEAETQLVGGLTLTVTPLTPMIITATIIDSTVYTQAYDCLGR